MRPRHVLHVFQETRLASSKNGHGSNLSLTAVLSQGFALVQTHLVRVSDHIPDTSCTCSKRISHSFQTRANLPWSVPYKEKFVILQSIWVIVIKSRETRAAIYTCRYFSGNCPYTMYVLVCSLFW